MNMSYQREQYEQYLNSNGIYNCSPYCSCLNKIEKLTQANIDKEYDTDKCEGLLQTLLEIRGNASDDAKKYGQIKNLISKLNKYCQFRENPDQCAVVPQKENFVAPIQPQVISDELWEPQYFKNNRMTVPMEDYIKHCHSFEQFEAQYLDQFLETEDRVGQYLEELLWKYDKDQATVSAEACYDRSYVGNIIRGKKNSPSRDALISICLAIGTTVDEVQHLLRYAGHAPLYVRRKRDVIIWFGFLAKLSATKVNIELTNHDFSPLSSKGKEN